MMEPRASNFSLKYSTSLISFTFIVIWWEKFQLVNFEYNNEVNF